MRASAMRVLICDDNQDAARVLGALVSLASHDTRLCYDGCSCVETTREWRPDVALVDIRMPDLDGYGVAQAIRKLDFGAEILLIALTAYAADDAVAAAKGAGFDLHLSKTVRPDEILRAIVSGGI